MIWATLLTLAALGVIFLAAFYRLWSSPPVLKISVTIPDIRIPVKVRIPDIKFSDINLSGLQIPDRLMLSLTHEPSLIETKPTEEPIPEDILDYISQESEQHAQDARKRRVRMLKVETGSWDAAFRLLQREDNALE